MLNGKNMTHPLGKVGFDFTAETRDASARMPAYPLAPHVGILLVTRAMDQQRPASIYNN